MKMAMRDGQILIREADNVQFTIIKSWGKMKWSRQTQTLSGSADIELLNRLAGLVNLPPSIEAERKKLNEVMAAVDRERMNQSRSSHRQSKCRHSRTRCEDTTWHS